MDPSLAGIEELAAGISQGRALVRVAYELEDTSALKVAARADAVGDHERVSFLAQ